MVEVDVAPFIVELAEEPDTAAHCRAIVPACVHLRK